MLLCTTWMLILQQAGEPDVYIQIPAGYLVTEEFKYFCAIIMHYDLCPRLGCYLSEECKDA